MHSIFQYLPNILPEGSITVDEEHEFVVQEYDGGGSHAKTVYLLDKAPINALDSVEAEVDGRTQTLGRGTDYAVIDDDNDGKDDSIDFGIGGDNPDAGSTFTVTYEAESILSRYVDAHQTQADMVESDADEVLDSHQVEHADVEELEQLGSFFGEIGKRRGRSEDDYRAFLKSIVNSFNARGTIPGLTFAIAAAIGADEDNITINEDFVEVGYTIEIDNVDTAFLTSSIIDMAELADPSGVELLEDPIVTLGDDEIIIEVSESTVTNTTSGLGSGTLSMDGSSTLQ